MAGAGKLLPLYSFSHLPLLSSRLLILSSVTSSPRPKYSLRRLSSVRTSNRTVTDELETSFRPKSLNSNLIFRWAEWKQLVGILTEKGYFDKPGIEFNASELREKHDLSEDFLRVSEALIFFSKQNPELIRSLPKDDITVLVENTSPHLFTNGENSALRLNNFLNGSIDNVAETLDVIQYILSYSYDNKNEISHNQIIDRSVKNLLLHLVNLIKPNETESPVRNFTMKRGDWICLKCKLKNFGRNNKCFECNEFRPKRNLTGEEWSCSQCEFFNHGRNNSCLRCDFKKPEKITKMPSILEEILNKANVLDNNNGFKTDKDPSVTKTLDRILNPSNGNKLSKEINWESLATQTGHVPFNPLPAKLFRKNNNDSTDFDARSEEIMPIRKGENRFVVNKKKDRSMTSPPYKKRIELEQANNENSENSYSGFVPFKPFPPDYFSKKRENKTSEMEKTEESDNNIKGVEVISSQENSYSNSKNSYSTNTAEESSNTEGSHSKKNYSDKTEEASYSNNIYSSNSYSENSGITESLDMSEEAKAERWFKRAAEIKDINELANIPDEDFPQIMPMRKGVNRFVVSKRKTALERRLTQNQPRENGDRLSFGESKGGENF